MKKELREKLSKYAAAAAAIGGVAGVNAQVVYTDINPDVEVNDDNNAGGFSLIGLDIDNNSAFDFIIAARDTTIASQGFTLRYSLAVPYNSSNAVAGYASGSFFYASALNNAANIDASLNWGSGSSFAATMGWSTYVTGSGTYQYGAWNGVADKYLALRFTDGANTYYGWARFTYPDQGDHFIVKDYAYNSTADGAIAAGDMGAVGLDGATLDQLVHFINKTDNTVLVKVNGLNGGTVNVVSANGQSVQSGEILNNEYVVDMNNLATGIYMINVTVEGVSLTKKMIVH